MCAVPLIIAAGILCWSHLAIAHFQRAAGTWVLYGGAQSAYYEKWCVVIESWVAVGLLFVLFLFVTFVALFRPRPRVILPIFGCQLVAWIVLIWGLNQLSAPIYP